ncbi:MAG: mannitol dehydrogenase family protein [Oscillospiraceae bacterium]|nr:mannitol dehydrogenase family protein [Oscillospiraceae bacterium]
MPQLTRRGLSDAAAWERAGIALPPYNTQAAAEYTRQSPAWLHFGAGNIFRGFIAALGDTVLGENTGNAGVVAVETFDPEIIETIYAPHDNLALLVTLLPDGGVKRRVIGSIAEGLTASRENGDFDRLRRYFEADSLQMVSFTVTEKGYALRKPDGAFLDIVARDMETGPDGCVHVMSLIAALLYARYRNGGPPAAMVSMDNCSRNGDKLRDAVTEIAAAWRDKGLAEAGFLDYLADPSRVSFPWSMIDKITPRPAPEIQKSLESGGVTGMDITVTAKGTYIAPFVNAEGPQYLVIEDAFPNGRPPLERAGVYFTSRETVDKVERMKVTTCLNPLHTALAVFGCLLGYTGIAEETRDPQLAALVRRIGYDEGLPVVTDPGIIDPRAFIDEVVTERLPNPFIPDTPQRIATDTSQKVSIRYGETIKAYVSDPARSVDSLIGIPLVIAGWLRYLLGLDDEGRAMDLPGDPLLPALQASLRGVGLGDPDSAEGRLTPVLRNASIFGADLVEAGLGETIEGYFRRMLEGRGAVRRLLTEVFPG